MNLPQKFFTQLYTTWGRQNWWPADSPFEVIVGAILTQNTAWTNVELALAQLRAAGKLTVDGVGSAPIPALEQLIRSAGLFRQKAQRLRRFVAFLGAHYS